MPSCHALLLYFDGTVHFGNLELAHHIDFGVASRSEALMTSTLCPEAGGHMLSVPRH